jgi:hypothetical protein
MICSPMSIALQPQRLSHHFQLFPVGTKTALRCRVVPIDRGPFPLWREEFSCCCMCLHPGLAFRDFRWQIPQRQFIAQNNVALIRIHAPERAVLVYFYVFSETDVVVSLFNTETRRDRHYLCCQRIHHGVDLPRVFAEG